MSFLGYAMDDYKYSTSSLCYSSMKLGAPYYSGPATLICPPVDATTFHAILAIDDKNNIITNSNSFLEDHNFVNNPHTINYDNIHTIFRRINIAYKYLTTNPVTSVIDREMFLLCNPFSGTNIGHDLSILLDRIYEYKQRKLNIPVVLTEFMKSVPRSIEVCQALLPDVEIYYIPNNTIIKFNKLHIAHNEIFNIIKHPELIQDIINFVVNTPMIKNNIDNYKNKKILLIKTNRNKAVVSNWSRFQAEKTIELLTNTHEYIYINPEVTHMYEIIAYLQYAAKIVTSFGAISYAHTIFFNPAIRYHYLMTSCRPYYYVDKHIIIKMPLDLDANIPTLLKELDRQTNR
jgi:hypothetical protein